MGDRMMPLSPENNLNFCVMLLNIVGVAIPLGGTTCDRTFLPANSGRNAMC